MKKRKSAVIVIAAVIAVICFCCFNNQTADKTASVQTGSSAGIMKTAQSGSSDAGRKAAEQINAIQDNEAYKENLRDVLDYYYSNYSKTGSKKNIASVGKTVDSRGKTIVADYKAAASERSSDSSLKYKSGEVLLTFSKGTSDSAIREKVKDERGTAGEINRMQDGTKLVSADISLEYTVSKAADIYAGDDAVESSQPNYRYTASAAKEKSVSPAAVSGTGSGTTETEPVKVNPNDTYYKAGYQWYLNGTNGIDAPTAWTVASSDASKKQTVKIAVIDTGVLASHDELNDGQIDAANSARIVGGTITSGSDTLGDSDGHGTHVSGIIDATSDNASGITGVATGAGNSVVSEIAIDAQTPELYGVFYSQDLVLSVNYAVSKGAKVINMSLGGPGNDKLLADAIETAYDKGVLVVTAAGNENTDALVSPSDSNDVISVIANNDTGSSRTGAEDFSAYSNFGTAKDISAPGDDILSTWIGSNNGFNKKGATPGNTKFAYDSGTSMAAPVVTGTAALLLYYEPSLTPRQVKNYLYSSGGSTSFSTSQAFGNLNAGTALTNLAADKEAAKSIVLNSTSLSVYTGDNKQIEYEVLPGTSSSVDAAWSSSNTAVASVSKEGIVTGAAEGTAVITASIGDVTASCTVTVKNKYSDVTFTDGSFETSGELTKDSAVSASVYKTETSYDDAAGYMNGYAVALLKNESISVSLSSSDYGAFVKLVGADGKIIKSDAYLDYDEEVKENNTASLTYNAPEDGTYYIQSCAVPNYVPSPVDSNVSSTGKYMLKIYKFDPCVSAISSVTYNSIRMKWSKCTNADGYKIIRATRKSGKYTTVKAFTRNTDLSYKNGSLTCGKTYYYKVIPYRTISGVTVYGKESSILSARVRPAVTSSVKAKGGHGYITVSWAHVSGATGYRVYRASSKTGSYKKLKTVSGGYTLKYSNTGLKKGKTYYYKVKAYRKTGKTAVYGSSSAAVGAKVR
ncbi:MAG: S8 family serine peptidase [Eubacteriaceae bacterium]|nr:S8 family serine peptidase [Eubacteriaceae bacterium]